MEPVRVLSSRCLCTAGHAHARSADGRAPRAALRLWCVAGAGGRSSEGGRRAQSLQRRELPDLRRDGAGEAVVTKVPTLPATRRCARQPTGSSLGLLNWREGRVYAALTLQSLALCVCRMIWPEHLVPLTSTCIPTTHPPRAGLCLLLPKGQQAPSNRQDGLLLHMRCCPRSRSPAAAARARWQAKHS